MRIDFDIHGTATIELEATGCNTETEAREKVRKALEEAELHDIDLDGLHFTIYLYNGLGGVRE